MEKMLKENRNIDDSYTDRVIKQLAKETQIDFKSGKVNLPTANYSWPFNHFGPGGLENALAIRKSSNFVKHIINNYGVDDGELKEILAMYIGVIAGRIQDGLERGNPPWLQEQIGDEDDTPNEVERQARYATQVVDWMVKETKIDDSHEDPSQWNIYAPHMGRWISPLGFISPNNRHWSAFENHMMEIYGLDWEMVGTAWNNYLKEVTTTFRLLAGKAQGDDTPPWDMQYDYLAESTEDNFLGGVLQRLVDETMIEYGEYEARGIPMAYPSWVIDDNEGVDLAVLLDSGYEHWNFKEFSDYVKNMYGLSEGETKNIWEPYLDGIDQKFSLYIAQNNLKHPWTSQWVNESTEDKFLDTIVSQLVDETEIDYDNGIPHISAFPDPDFSMDTSFYLNKDLSQNLFGEMFKSFWSHCRNVYGLTDPEIQKVWWEYKKEVLKKIEWKESLNESLNSRVKKEVDDLWDEDKKLKGEDKIKKHFEDKGLNKQDADEAMVQYLSKQQSLNESVDLSYSDDKDFPFLNKLANHTMSITEISRNAVMFPFIEGYISDGNFYKYFHGTPYDQLPFEATIKMDGYLKDFGLTENEKEIWWDIYVIKVIDAINERDLRIIDSHGELNESTEDVYEKMAQSIANESEIFEEGGKLFLISPSFESSVNVEVVLDIMSGRTKRAIPNSFVKHMKEVYNIEKKGYNTVLETVWALYRDKMVERIKIKQAQQRQIIPKQQKFFNHIIKTLVGETEVQTMKDWLPDDETYEHKVWVVPPFLNHKIDIPGYRDDSVEWSKFSFFGYGYHRYMKDIYGLTDEEVRKLWSPYYKALEKKVEELIERDRIIYGDE